MQKELNEVFKSHFSCIEDPRIERRKRHLLIDVIAIAICAVISGADHWIDIEAYAQEKEAWLKTFLESPNGIPSHDTIARVFSRLEPTQFQHAFLSWIKTLKKQLPGEVIANCWKNIERFSLSLSRKKSIACGECLGYRTTSQFGTIKSA